MPTNSNNDYESDETLRLRQIKERIPEMGHVQTAFTITTRTCYISVRLVVYL